ncbi:MAG TPA: serine/threonine-protein kinase, partial [Myxococcales bacterium]|nr:serine/threonine-protein kinase [Myxococcales bacterium]
RWIYVVNACVEVSAPSAFLIADTLYRGPEYALSAPPMVVWGALVMTSALRSWPRLALVAGAMAAAEYGLIYWLLILPRLPPDALVTFRPAMILARVALLFCFGPLTALTARHILRQAELAISAIRAQDLMGKYLLHERVGSGGMAEVFRATYSPEGGFEKTVAVKRVLPAFAEDPEFVALFRQEAELCSMLNHPNIIQVLDLVRHGDTLFLAMEFIDGPSLKAVLRAMKAAGTRLPFPAVTYLGAEIASALDYVHRKAAPDGAPLNLVHRDLNPPNILVSQFGEVKLADFGIARAMGRSQVTRVGTVRGKAGYMAPEQASARPFDGRADLFALGLTLHEVLTGERVLKGDSDAELMRASVEQPLPPPSAVRPDVPPALDQLVMKLLQRLPRDRTPSAELFRQSLLALPPELAPYPRGRGELSHAVRATLGDLARSQRLVPEPSLLSQIGTVPAVPPGPPGAEGPNPTALTIKVRTP